MKWWDFILVFPELKKTFQIFELIYNATPASLGKLGLIKDETAGYQRY